MYSSGPMTGVAAAAAYYPYLQFAEGNGPVTGYAPLHYPNHMFHYSTLASSTGGNYPHHNGSPVSLAPSPVIPSGLCNYLFSIHSYTTWKHRGTDVLSSVLCSSSGLTTKAHGSPLIP